MYSSLLVPLDRSSFAEQALPLALAIARRANARLDLVEVHALYALLESHSGWERFDPARDTEYRRQEELYLDATAKWMTSISAVATTASVLSGSAVLPETVVDAILERARVGQADLIVMATHGRGPLNRFGLGSVADQVVRRASLPVLLVRPREPIFQVIPEPILNNFLIPLDGSPLAEQVLTPALELARLMEARCSLLRVVPPHSSHTSGGPNDRLGQAEVYLRQVAEQIREQRLQVEARVVVARHEADAILADAEAHASSLIALATHGRGGLKRLLLGSVADKVVRGAVTPVLVYRPTDTKS